MQLVMFQSWAVRGAAVLINPEQVCSVGEGFMPNAKPGDKSVCRLVYTADGTVVKVLETVDQVADKLCGEG